METLGIRAEFIALLNNYAIKNPTAVQKRVIPSVLNHRSCFFESETGTGKTLAYLIPLLQLYAKKSSTVQIIILAPTVELASQIKVEAQKYSPNGAALCFGGSPIKRQIESLKKCPNIVVGSAMRLTELVRLKKLKLQGLSAVVLDEVDRLFSKELIDETRVFLDIVKTEALALPQLIACSATLSVAGREFLQNYVGVEHDVHILPKEVVLQKRIEHWAFYAEKRKKVDTLRSFLHAAQPNKTLIFCNRSDDTERIVDILFAKKIDCAALHARLPKTRRKQVVDRFRSGKLSILITSDVSARGLDIPDISHIIHFDMPQHIDFFIHRTGRTARNGKTGINVVIGDEWELRQFAQFEKKLGIIVYPKELYGGKVQGVNELEQIN